MLMVEVARPLPVCAPNSIAPYPEFVEEIIDVFVGLKLTKCKIVSGNFNAHLGYDAGLWKDMIGQHGAVTTHCAT